VRLYLRRAPALPSTLLAPQSGAAPRSYSAASESTTPGATPTAEGGAGRGAGTDAYGLMGEVLGFATSLERIV